MDIVEQLRTRNGRPDGFGLGTVCDAAADEIERLRAAVASEREACAKLVSDVGDDWEAAGDMRKVAACDYLEDAIRARADQQKEPT